MASTLKAQTISELTNYQFRELVYNSADQEYSFPFIAEVCELLNKAMQQTNAVSTVYTQEVSERVAQFQSMAGMSATGILNDATLQTLILFVEKNASDTVEDDSTEEMDAYGEESESPHYDSFFDEDRYKVHRQNRKDIKIVFGQGSIKKTIVDVFMRSVSVEIDTSGNPISEIYEFIARDVKESDELSDYDKYNPGVDNLTAPSDIQYDFSEYVGGDSNG